MLFLHSINDKDKRFLTKLLISSCYRITQLLSTEESLSRQEPDVNVYQMHPLVKVSYGPKLAMPLDSRKQFKRHGSPIPLSPSASLSLPPFSSLYDKKKEDMLVSGTGFTVADHL